MATAYWDAELETLPWSDVERWQAPQVTSWVADLAQRSAFHADKLHAVHLPDEPRDLGFLADLPSTTKAEIRASQQEEIPGQPFGRHQGVALPAIVQTLSSSGSTGDPVFFALTARDLEVWRDGMATGFFITGVRADDVVAHLVGLPGVAGGLPYADGLRHLGAELAWLGGLPTERILRTLRPLQVTTVLSTTSFGTYLADKCQEVIGDTATTLGVKRLLGGGESGLAQPEIREKIRSGWGLDEVREMMGLGDVMSLLWAECEQEGGMHFCGQRSVAIELIDPATDEQLSWEEGAQGEMLYTTFLREATPALRYRSADHMLVTATDCGCGRTSPRVRCVGRTDDMLIYKAMNVFPTAIRQIVLDRFGDVVEPYLRIWKDHAEQVRYDEPIPLDVEAREQLEPDHYARIGDEIERELRTRLQVRTAVSVLAPGSVPRSAYKTPLVHVRTDTPTSA